MKYKSISIIIPVYNEANFIGDVISNVVESDTKGLKKEIIIIDDGSTDKTKSRIKNTVSRLKNKKAQIKTIFRRKNEGKGSCLKAGFLKSTGDIVLIQDGDLEYDPQDYPALLEPFLRFDADVVCGSRFVSNKPRRILYFWHYLANNLLTFFSNVLTNLNLTDMETGYKVFRGEIIRNITGKLESKRFGFEPEIVSRISKIPGVKIYEIGISYRGRTYKEGKKITWFDGIRAFYEVLKFNLFSD